MFLTNRETRPRPVRPCVLLLIFVLIPIRSGKADFNSLDIYEIPVGRLALNIIDDIKANPKDARARYNLARLHAMAFALKTETVKTSFRREKDGVWLGHSPKHLPFDNRPTRDEDKLRAAKRHLRQAIARYEDAIRLRPDFLPAKLGHAWCIEQSGRRAEAVALYRKLIAEGLTREKKAKADNFSDYSAISEACEYLVPLLDAKKDAKEIAMLEKEAKIDRAIRRRLTPIIVPLSDKANVEGLINRHAAVTFDLDGSGERKRWTWIRKDAGWLVYDPNGRGEITSALQMFGNVTFWLFWDNGYQALAALDDNRDGMLRSNELAGLAIWRDANGNGVSEPGEVLPVADWGIVGLSCQHKGGESDANLAAFATHGVILSNGTTRPTYDVILQRQPETGVRVK